MTIGTWNKVKALVKGAKNVSKTNKVPKNVIFGGQCNETKDSLGFTVLFSRTKAYAALDNGEIYIVNTK